MVMVVVVVVEWPPRVVIYRPLAAPNRATLDRTDLRRAVAGRKSSPLRSDGRLFWALPGTRHVFADGRWLAVEWAVDEMHNLERQ